MSLIYDLNIADMNYYHLNFLSYYYKQKYQYKLKYLLKIEILLLKFVELVNKEYP